MAHASMPSAKTELNKKKKKMIKAEENNENKQEKIKKEINQRNSVSNTIK